MTTGRDNENGRILVAGATGGIGAACVQKLTASGAKVAGVDRSEAADNQMRDLDITQPGMAEQAVAYAENKFGGLDGLVHAVGMSGRRLGDGPVSTCTDEAWAEVLRVNLESTFRLLRAGMPALRRAGGGSIVVVGSVLARSADPDFLTAAYAASKGGIESLARAAAREGTADNIRVNVVAAGLVQTPMAGRASDDPHIQQRLADLQPLGGEMLDPDDVAEAVTWLLSGHSPHITGAVIPVDAGWLL